MNEPSTDDLAEHQRDAANAKPEPQGPQVPSPTNPQQPAGVVPPGGPLPSTGDILAGRQAEQTRQTVEGVPPQETHPTDAELEHAKDMPADEAKGTPG